MIYVGIDDTDTLDTPGTNQLARHLAKLLADRWRLKLITRHQLLEDPRVPCTRKNGCVAMTLEPSPIGSVGSLIECIEDEMRRWCPRGSDPGICITEKSVPDDVVAFGIRCQRELVTQVDARALAAKHQFYLHGLGGTEDGVIGALAAVGLAAAANSGRVIMVGQAPVDHYEVSGLADAKAVLTCGVDEIRRADSSERVLHGTIELGKRLRPNLRRGKVVLFVLPSQSPGVDWNAERLP